MADTGGALAPIDQAAILLLAMGEDEAARVLRHLEPRQVQRVGAAMAALAGVDHRQMDRVVDHFLQTVSAESGVAMSANDYLRKMLLGALGERRAGSVLERIVSGSRGGFGKLKWMEARAIAGFILHEHPQIQAVVLSYLPPDRAVEVLSSFPDDASRGEVLVRVAGLDTRPAGAPDGVDAVLGQKTPRQRQGRAGQLGGRRAAAEILRCMQATARAAVLAGIRRRDEALATEIQALLGVGGSAP